MLPRTLRELWLCVLSGILALVTGLGWVLTIDAMLPERMALLILIAVTFILFALLVAVTLMLVHHRFIAR